MADPYTSVDQLEILLSGGASNYSPSLSLGGACSAKIVKGMNVQYINPIEGLIIEDATPENTAGIGTISVTSGSCIYTPPGDNAGVAVALAAGETKLLTGSNPAKAVRVRRVAGDIFEGLAEFKLIDAVQGVLSMGNVTDAQRQAGGTFYRAVFLHAWDYLSDIKAWVTTDGQSSWALALEEPDSLFEIQEIADETTAPTGLSWVNAVSLATALDVGILGQMSEDDYMGLWIRRTFPAVGTVAVSEQVNFHLQWDG